MTLLPFLLASAMLYFVTHVAIPLLSQSSGQEPIIFWFLMAGAKVFLPMMIATVVFIHRESHLQQETTLRELHRIWQERLRFRSMSRADWWWTLGALASIAVLSALITLSIRATMPEASLHPSFMHLAPLTPNRYWLLGLWFPYWLLNIMGEEMLWRGVLLPLQERALGHYAWLLNALGWLLFHLAFGGVLVLTLVPILLILPAVVQKRQNSWVGVVIHGGLNGPGFLAVAFGLV